ncbi:hypothetical protein ACWC5I_33845 [Kitasatospora sp. NPDC001574]
MVPTPAQALAALSPLAGGVVVGRQQVVRRGGVVITAELNPAGHRPGDSDGVRVRAVLLSNGAELGQNLFTYADHATFPQPNAQFLHTVHSLHDIALAHAQGTLAAGFLRQAIGQYVDIYVGALAEPPPERPAKALSARAEAARATGTDPSQLVGTTTPPPSAPPLHTPSAHAHRSR